MVPHCVRAGSIFHLRLFVFPLGTRLGEVVVMNSYLPKNTKSAWISSFIFTEPKLPLNGSLLYSNFPSYSADAYELRFARDGNAFPTKLFLISTNDIMMVTSTTTELDLPLLFINY